MRAATKPSPPLLPGPATTTIAAAGRMARGDPFGDRAAGILHQVDAGDPARNRQPVGLGHFGGGEQFIMRRIIRAMAQEYVNSVAA